MKKLRPNKTSGLKRPTLDASLSLASQFSRNALILGVLAALAAPGIALAQSNTEGALVGTASAPNSVISVVNRENGATRTVSSDATGHFRAGALPPGSYKVSYTDASGKVIDGNAEVVLGSSASVYFVKDEVVQLEAVRVNSYSVNPVDFDKTESVTVFTDKLLDVLPVAQSVNAVALLAPGTTKGSSFFGDLVSFGGSSVAENVYYVNGFNISNFRNGLDPTTVPYEFYSSFEVKTGAYSAEFGRSTGGVVNTTTKYGTNQYHAGASVYYSPNALRAHRKDIYYTDTGVQKVYSYNSHDSRTNVTANVYASGALWKDHLFVYGLYTKRDNKIDDVVSAGQSLDQIRDKDPFWGVKTDFFPIKNHHLEYTVFSDKSTSVTTEYPYEVSTNKADFASEPSINYDRYGGTNHIVRYTGTLTEDLTLSALFGKNRADRTSSSSVDSQPAIYDTRAGHLDWLSGNTAISTSNGYDTRQALRADLEYAFKLAGSHRLRGGYDSEDNKSTENTVYSGGHYWRYYTVKPGAALAGGTVPAGVTEVVRERIYNNSGNFEVKNKAEYIEDNWSLLSERLLLRLGLRNESFENLNAKGQTFIKKDSQLAPRLGVSYDLFGDKTTKLFANYGRYHLPIASNTNIRLAGGEIYTQDYFVLRSINSDHTPVKGDHIGNQTVYSDGSIKDPATIVDKNIKPMYQDEYVFGVQRQLNKNWTATARVLSRDLKTSIDDIIITQGLVNYAKRNNITTFVKPSANPYVLANPGSDVSINYDINDDGKDESITLTKDDLGFPVAKRKYYAGELAIEKIWDGKWNSQFSYTWSHSYGNSEGLVKSDNGQTDAGLTSNFDALGLTNGSYGDLPNDHRHQFKAFGAYAITKEIQAGLSLNLTSGKPVNKLGVYPKWDLVANGYGAEAFWTGDETGSVSPRGSAGRTPWVFTQDVSLTYKPAWGKNKLSFSVDVFNVLNRHGVQDVVEQYEQATGNLNPQYLLGRSYQTPRYVRIGAKIDF